jgi:phosphoribosylformimino-5-aminoimidazole carboxamide ribotide isomerase
MVALDARRGKVVIEGWTQATPLEAREVAKRAEEMGAGSLLFTNIDVEGLMQGIEAAIIAEIVHAVNVPVVASGGVSSMEDVREIKRVGASGVVIGSALYLGKIDFKDLLRTF